MAYVDVAEHLQNLAQLCRDLADSCEDKDLPPGDVVAGLDRISAELEDCRSAAEQL